MQWVVSIVGRDAVQRAERTAGDLVARLRAMLRGKGMADFEDVSVEVLGSEQSYGSRSRALSAREVALKMAFAHEDRGALALVKREMPSIGLAMAQGLSAGGTGRPRPTPIIRLHSFLVPRGLFPAKVELDGDTILFGDPVVEFADVQSSESSERLVPEVPEEPTVELPLMAIAYGRSGDKGNNANIGVAARHEDFLPVIRAQVTSKAVLGWFNHLVKGPVERFELPGIMAFNFLLRDALGGGGTASLRFDPQGKAFGQILLDLPVQVPVRFLNHPAVKRIVEVEEARC